MATGKTRKLSRLGNEFHLDATMAVIALGQGRYAPGVVALLLLSRCAADWTATGRIVPPERPSRAMSIRAAAASLHAPYASIHRHMTRLEQGGLVVKTARGWAISTAPDVAPVVTTFLSAAHDLMVRLINDLAPDLALPRPSAKVDPSLHAAIVATALDMWLIPFEVARTRVADWTDMIVWLVIVVANVRHITIDPALSERFSRDPTPTDQRRPISTRAIAGLTGLSYNTVYRHCQALAARNVVRYDDGSWVLTTAQLADEGIERGVVSLLDYYARRINELVALGMDITATETLYLDARPGYVPLPDQLSIPA